MVKACIFDLDGVVVDTAKYHYLAWKAIGKELNFNFTEDDNERLKGISRIESLNILLEIGKIKLTDKEKQAYADKKNNRYKDYIAKMTPDEILPGVIDIFKELKSNDIKIALGSASKNAVSILEKLNIVNWFDAIIDGNQTQKAKPDPEVFLLGAKALNIDPANCIVFEDAEAGVEAALNAGMYCIGIGSPKNLNKAHKVMPNFIGLTLNKLDFN